MKIKTILFILVFLVLVWSTNLLGQPVPGDVQWTTNDPKPVGGGADLMQNLSVLVVPALFYMLYKLRFSIGSWLSVNQ